MAEGVEESEDWRQGIDYRSLMKSLYDAAQGAADEPVSTVITRDTVDSDGKKTHVVQRRAARKPDVGLLMKLLDEYRIGGPQDYC